MAAIMTCNVIVGINNNTAADLVLANIEALSYGETGGESGGEGGGCLTIELGGYTGNDGSEYMISFYCLNGIAPGCLEGFEIWYGGDPWNGGEITYNNKTYKEC